jgi:hypothetical protein
MLTPFDTEAEDCGAVVGDAPTCADPSWTLYMDAYAFCCQSGEVGIQGEQCQPKSLTFSAALYAATVIPPPGTYLAAELQVKTQPRLTLCQ